MKGWDWHSFWPIVLRDWAFLDLGLSSQGGLTFSGWTTKVTDFIFQRLASQLYPLELYRDSVHWGVVRVQDLVARGYFIPEGGWSGAGVPCRSLSEPVRGQS